MHNRMLRIGLQFFGEPPAEPQSDPSPTPPQELNFEELIKTDTRLQAFVNTAAENAVKAYQQKQQKLHDDKVSESEKLKTMTSEEVADYYRKKYEAAELEKQRIRDADALRTQTAKLLIDGGIPSEFIGEFDFENTTAETIKKSVDFLGKYEIYPKGTFETKVNEALAEKLKQKAPETGGAPKGDASNLRKYFGL